jgi:hypothetical protein
MVSTVKPFSKLQSASQPFVTLCYIIAQINEPEALDFLSSLPSNQEVHIPHLVAYYEKKRGSRYVSS